MFREIAEPPVVGSRQAFVLPLSILAHLVLLAMTLVMSVLAPGVLPVPATALMAFVNRDVFLPQEPPLPPRQSVAARARVLDIHREPRH